MRFFSRLRSSLDVYALFCYSFWFCSVLVPVFFSTHVLGISLKRNDIIIDAYYTGYCSLFVALMVLPLLQRAVCC